MRALRAAPSVLLYAALIFGGWSLYVATAYPRVQRAEPVLEPALNEAVRAAIFLLPALLLLRADGERPWRYLKLGTHAGRGIAWGVLAGGALLAGHAIPALASSSFGANPVPVKAFFTSLSVATLIEEIAFRGFVLQRVEERTGFWAANAIAAALFAAIHLPGWLIVGGMGMSSGLLRPLLEIFALGLALGFLLRRTGSLWAPFLVHAANNLAYILFYSPG